MPRNVPRERAPDLIPIGRVLQSMTCYEDEAQEINNEFSWWTNFWGIFSFPVPSKMEEVNVSDNNEFTTRKSQFFRKVRKDTGDESEQEDDPPDPIPPLGADGEREIPDDDWKMYDCYRHCHRILFWSRIYILILQFIGANWFGDTFYTDAFRGADDTIKHTERLRNDPSLYIVNYVIGGLRRWDAQYFLFVMDNDYLLETSLAFFPGYVTIIRIFRTATEMYILKVLNIEVERWILTAVLSVLFNQFCFQLAGLVLFILTYQCTRSIKIGLMAVSLFAYNPASIFFSAAYSESFYALMTFSTLLFVMFASRIDNFFAKSFAIFFGSLLCSISVLIRTNGLLNMGFMGWFMCGAMVWENEEPYENLDRYPANVPQARNRRAREEYENQLRELTRREIQTRKEFRLTMRGKSAFVTWLCIISFAIMIVSVVTPSFVLYGKTMTGEFCHKNSHLASYAEKWSRMMKNYDVVKPGEVEKISWCQKPYVLGFWPTFYSSIQQKYWDVGFLSYWKVQKIPCFLLATPALILTALAILHTYSDVFGTRKWFNIWILFGRSDHLTPFAIHAAALMILGVFVINAEVFTRIIFSSTPFLYIFLAKWIDGRTRGNTFANTMLDYHETYALYPMFLTKRIWKTFIGKLLIIYFFSYFIFGTIAHAAWLPFT